MENYNFPDKCLLVIFWSVFIDLTNVFNSSNKIKIRLKSDAFDI